MDKLVKQIQKLNQIYDIMRIQYDSLKKMFKNHSGVKQKVILSEQILHQAYALILEKTEEVATNREFNKIVKDVKNENKDN
jgi:ABC-type Na+ transport system ATPase subunit NatA